MCVYVIVNGKWKYKMRSCLSLYTVRRTPFLVIFFCFVFLFSVLFSCLRDSKVRRSTWLYLVVVFGFLEKNAVEKINNDNVAKLSDLLRSLKNLIIAWHDSFIDVSFEISLSPLCFIFLSTIHNQHLHVTTLSISYFDHNLYFPMYFHSSLSDYVIILLKFTNWRRYINNWKNRGIFLTDVNINSFFRSIFEDICNFWWWKVGMRIK